MNSPSAALRSIKNFIDNYRFNLGDFNFETQEDRHVYRRFHALLLWELAVDREGENSYVRLYFREFLSDCATAYYLNFIGIHKASRLSLRGAIENIFRVFCARCELDVESINTIPMLVAECRRVWGGIGQDIIVNSLYESYTELCKTVHSVSVDYMSLRVPFENISSQNRECYNENLTLLGRVFRGAGDGMFCSFSANLTDLNYKDADYIRDSVPADIKRFVSDRTD